MFESRDALVGFMRKALTPAVTSVHFAHHPEITVVGSTAEGSWAFEDTVIIPEHRCLIRGAGYYRDGYRRDDDGPLADHAHVVRADLRVDDLARRCPEFRVPRAHVGTAAGEGRLTSLQRTSNALSLDP